MKTVRDIGLKITPSQREFYRYTGLSAALERRGAGTSRPDLAWVLRQKREEQGRGCPGNSEPNLRRT
jgi:hypothetical protein